MRIKSLILGLLFVAATLFTFSCSTGLDGKDVKVLFVGNSFIYSSDVGATLQSMARENDKALKTESASYGNGIVYEFFDKAISDFEAENKSTWGYRLLSGYFDYLFVQAVFDNRNNGVQSFISEFETLGIATKIVLLPAYNEDFFTTLSLKEQLNLTIMPWYRLHYELLNRGLTAWDLNQTADDWHANALSGYAAASMIYYSFYGEMPEILENTHIKLMKGYHISGSSIASYTFGMRGLDEEKQERFETIRTTAIEIANEYNTAL